MSDEAVSRFLEILKADRAAAGELAAIATTGGEGTVSGEAVIELAARYGCRFTPEELNARLAADSDELSDSQLDRVSGGVTFAAKTRSYSLVFSEEGSVSIRFGDGVHGQRLPSGSGNVSASYSRGGGGSGKAD